MSAHALPCSEHNPDPDARLEARRRREKFSAQLQTYVEDQATIKKLSAKIAELQEENTTLAAEVTRLHGLQWRGEQP